MKTLAIIAVTIISIILLFTSPAAFFFILLCGGGVYLIVICWPFIVACLSFCVWFFAFALMLTLLSSEIFWASILGLIGFPAVLYVLYKVISAVVDSGTISTGNTHESDSEYESSSFSPSEERAYLAAERIKDIKRNL